MPDHGLTRRRLGGLAAVGLGAPLIAACGSDDAGSADDAPNATTGAVLAATDDVPVGGGVILQEERLVITQPSTDEFKAFSSICTHQRCPVTEVTDTIDCTCHGSRFSLTDGSVVDGPATEPLPEHAISVEGGRITLD